MATSAAAYVVARPAEACSPPPDLSLWPDLVDGAIAGLPTDGVIAFRANSTGALEDALGLLTIEVTQDGVSIAGTIETIEISSNDDFGVESRDLFVVWRPDAALAPSTDYVATISVATAGDPEIFDSMAVLDITTGTDAAGALPQPQLGGAELGKQPFGAGPRVCCDVNDSCGFVSCAAPEQAEQPTVTAAITAGPDPLFSQMYLRARAGTDDATEEYAVVGIAAKVDGNGLQFSFPEIAGNYCLGVEAVSLIDGSALPVVVQCVAHGDLVLESGPNPDFDSFLGQCVGDPYWEDTNDPYEPDGGSRGDGGGSSGDDADNTGDDVGSLDDGEDGSSGLSDGDSGVDQDGTADGCACTLDDGRSQAPGWFAVVLGAASIRRRRR